MINKTQGIQTVEESTVTPRSTHRQATSVKATIIAKGTSSQTNQEVMVAKTTTGQMYLIQGNILLPVQSLTTKTADSAIKANPKVSFEVFPLFKRYQKLGCKRNEGVKSKIHQWNRWKSSIRNADGTYMQACYISTGWNRFWVPPELSFSFMYISGRSSSFLRHKMICFAVVWTLTTSFSFFLRTAEIDLIPG